MQIALTGASGHIGAALVRQLLDAGHPVRALVRQDDRALRGLDIDIVWGDLHAPDALDALCSGVDAVYHLAGCISIGDIPETELQRINVEGTRLLIAACLKAGVRRLIYFSSVHAFAAVPAAQVFDESAPLATRFPYERSKAAAQTLVLAANGQKGLETLCLNPTSVLGPWDFKPSLQGKMLLDLYQDKIPLLTPGGFDWVDNRDLARAALVALEKGRPGSVYLLSGRFVSMLELAKLFGSLIKRPMPARAAPFWLLRLLAPFILVWGKATGQKPLFTPEALSYVEHGHPNVSHAKASADLGYAPRPLEETLADTWNFLKSTFKI